MDKVGGDKQDASQRRIHLTLEAARALLLAKSDSRGYGRLEIVFHMEAGNVTLAELTEKTTIK